MITRVDGIRVGHHTDRTGITGSTVVVCPPGTSGSCDVKGGAPGTRETDAIRPGTVTPEVHAVVLSGGSAFGLAAADGVMRWLEERGVGFDTGLARVPIVPAAIVDEEVIVAALAVVNALGDITEDDGTPIAANRNPDAEPVTWPGTNTTLAVVATNATCSKERAQLLAQAGSEGISLAVRPSHTMFDGDIVFALATGAIEAPQSTLERLAVRAVAESIRRAVRKAEPLGGFPAVGTLD